MQRRPTKPKKPPGTNGKTTGRNCSTGRFTTGNPGGPGGDHYSEQRRQQRAIFEEAVTPEDMRRAARKLVQLALVGKPWALRYLCDRYWGKPAVTMIAAEVDPKDCGEMDFEYL